MCIRPGLLFLAGLLAAIAAMPASAQLSFQVAFPGLGFAAPVAIEHAPDGNDWLYVVEQAGRIRVFDNDPAVSSADLFLDISGSVNSSGWEMGLLGLAFHPDYAANGYLYVNYTTGTTATRRTRISRFTRSAANPRAADAASELILLEFPQPFNNHNGGDLTFGPDGYLYIASGDGGSGGDPQDHGQNTATLLGTILRIDVDADPAGAPPDCGASGAPYTIPDNAIADGPGGACDEIYAYGLRNPWRISFDPETGRLWVADVGQEQREEVNIVENGDNLGWRVKEGTLCFATSNHGPPCNDPSLVDPIHEYGFAGQQSITGGFVYRGDRLPELAGRYVYADFMTGHLWALGYEPESWLDNALLFHTNLGASHGRGISTFGVDRHGHLYFAVFGSPGRIYSFTSPLAGEEPAAGRQPVLALAGPNPASRATALRWAAPRPGLARLAVVDLLGREVAVAYEGPAGAESVRTEVDVSRLAPGPYVAVLRVDGERVGALRFSVLR